MLVDTFRSLWSQNETCLGNRLKAERLGCLWSKNLPEEPNRWVAAECSMSRLNCLGCSPLVAMMKTSHLWEFNNVPHLWRLNGPGFRGVFGQP